MKTIQLKLDAAWHFFESNSQQFRPVKNKHNFHHGDLLYKDSEFFLVHRKKKIVPISWCQAGKKIYGNIRNFTRRSFNVSKQKVVFAFKINADEEVQTSIKPDTYPYPYERIEPVRIPPSNKSDKPDLTIAERRAKELMRHVVSSNPRLSMKGNFLYVNSKNGKSYYISIRNGVVYNSFHRSVCVTMRCGRENIPLYDQIIAKALTIAYAHKRISTLN